MPLQTGRPDAAACARVRTNQKAVGSSRTAGVQYVRMSVHACHACTRGPCMRMHAHAGHACACMYTLAMHACTRVPCTARTHTQHLLFAHALQDRIMEDEMDRLRDAMEIAKRRHARKNACTHTDGCAHVHTMTHTCACKPPIRTCYTARRRWCRSQVLQPRSSHLLAWTSARH